jgi:integrase
LNYWLSAFKGRTLASITRSDLKSFSLSLPAGKSASYKNSILSAGLIPLGWAYEEGMIPADIAKDFERYSGKAGKRRVLTVEEAGALFAKPWADGAAMAANLLSATTGMRQGEVLAVRGLLPLFTTYTPPSLAEPVDRRRCPWGITAPVLPDYFSA